MPILLTILALILVLAAICVVRTMMVKPTPAAEAKIELKNDARSAEYGEKLAKMIRCETISQRGELNPDKFEAFHTVLEELFPNVHARCEKHVFDGSLLYKWAGRGQADPIVLMSHQDVVEAGGKWEHDPSPATSTKTAGSGAGAPWTPKAVCSVSSPPWRS